MDAEEDAIADAPDAQVVALGATEDVRDLPMNGNLIAEVLVHKIAEPVVVAAGEIVTAVVAAIAMEIVVVTAVEHVKVPATVLVVQVAGEHVKVAATDVVQVVKELVIKDVKLIAQAGVPLPVLELTEAL